MAHPFYSYFTELLQSKTDSAMVAIVSGFKERDMLTLVEREQTIGAAPIYLSFAQLSEALQADLQFAIQNQQ